MLIARKFGEKYQSIIPNDGSETETTLDAIRSTQWVWAGENTETHDFQR
jgi:hypothetical protein